MTTATGQTEISLPLGEPLNVWKEYGIVEQPALFRGKDGQLYDTKKHKVITRNGEFATIVSRRYTVLPNEEVLKLIEEAGYKTHDVKYSNNGNALYATLLSERVHAVRIGDIVKAGVLVRNSIDASTGFGVDMYTERLKCLNGAVSRGQEITWSRKHIGHREAIIGNFKQALERITLASEQLIATYKLADQIRLNRELAKKIVETKVPIKYLPDSIQVEKKTKAVTLTDTPTLYEAFNHSTAKIWHNDKLKIESKIQYEQALHKVILLATVSR